MGWLDQYKKGGWDKPEAVVDKLPTTGKAMGTANTPAPRYTIEQFKEQERLKKLHDKFVLDLAQQNMKEDPSIFNKKFYQTDATGRGWRDRLEDMGTDLQGSVFKGDPIVDYISPLAQISNMAGTLAKAPKRAQQENSVLPYVTAIGEPLVVGAAGNLLPKRFAPTPGNMYRALGEEGYRDALESNVLRAKQFAPVEQTGINLRKTFKKPFFTNAEHFSALEGYNPQYIAEVPEGVSKFSPRYSTRNDWSFIPAETEIPLDKATLYKKNWLTGYKKI